MLSTSCDARIWYSQNPTSTSECAPCANIQSKASKNKSRSYRGYNKKNKSGDNGLWIDAVGWLPHYRCSTCREVMSRKDPSKSPQKIKSCAHIVCAGCIAKSYYLELNPLCPVAGCGKCVNPSDATKTAATVSAPVTASITTPLTTPVTTPDTETTITFDLPNLNALTLIPFGIVQKQFEEQEQEEWQEQENPEDPPREQWQAKQQWQEREDIHYCGDRKCEWDCGTLWCGCIDVCRCCY